MWKTVLPAERMAEMLSIVRLLMSSDELLVANTGAPFSRKGVVSLCHSHLSAKAQGHEIVVGRCPDSELVEHLRQTGLAVYRADPNRLRSDINQARETSGDYRGRVLLELLQNAEDAQAEAVKGAAIGAKGLGFKSVLALTDEPEVHSGPFHFRFSRADSLSAIRKELGDHQAESFQKGDAPAFSIPHPVPVPCLVRQLLDEGFVTVVRLPFRAGAAQLVKDQVDRFQMDGGHQSLLFLEYMRTIEFQSPDRRLKWEIVRPDSGDGECVIRVEDGQGVEETRWMRWVERSRDGTRAITLAIPRDRATGLPVNVKKGRVFVFFPTREDLGLKAILHLTAEPDSNRETLRQPDVAGAGWADLLPLIGTCMRRFLADKRVPVPVRLRAVVGAVSSVDDHLAALRGEVARAARETAFIPCIGGKVAMPGQVRVWGHRVGDCLRAEEKQVSDAGLLEVELSSDPDVRSDLNALGSRPLAALDAVALLRYCRNGSIEDCRQVIMALARVVGPVVDEKLIAAIRAVPCWWVAGGKARGLTSADDRKILRTDNLKVVPEWIDADLLDEAIGKCLDAKPEGADHQSVTVAAPLTKALAGYLLRDPSFILRCCLTPVLQRRARGERSEEWWEEYGWEALVFAVSLLAASRNRIRDEKGRTEALKLVGSSLAVTGNKNQAIGEETEEACRELAEFMRVPTGTGWMFAVKSYLGESWGASAWVDDVFCDNRCNLDRGVLLSPDQWPADVLKEVSESQWKELFEHLGVSGGLKAVSGTIDCADVALDRLCEEPALLLRELNYVWQELSADCRAQLSNRELLPHRPCALFANDELVRPNLAYQRGRGLPEILPELEAILCDEFPDILRNLGLRTELPKTLAEWVPLCERLKSSVRIGRGWTEQRSLARRFWKACLETVGRQLRVESGVFVPHARWAGEREVLEFSLPSDPELYWLDDPALLPNAVRQELLRGLGWKLFVLEGNEGRRCGDVLGLRKASSQLQRKPRFKDGEKPAWCLDRYSRRRQVLGRLLELRDDQELPEIAGARFHFVSDLKLELSISGKVVGEAPVDTFRNEPDQSILVNVRFPERALAEAVGSHVGLSPTQCESLELHLARSDEDFRDRAFKLGIGSEEFDRLMGVDRQDGLMQSPNGELFAEGGAGVALPKDGDGFDDRAGKGCAGVRPRQGDGVHFDQHDGNGGSAERPVQGGGRESPKIEPPMPWGRYLEVIPGQNSQAIDPDHPAQSDPEVARRRKITGDNAVTAVMMQLRRSKWCLHDQHRCPCREAHDANQPGYDVKVSREGQTRFIEVKGLEGEWTDRVAISPTQGQFGVTHRDEFLVAVVERANEPRPRVCFLQHPFESWFAFPPPWRGSGRDELG